VRGIVNTYGSIYACNEGPGPVPRSAALHLADETILHLLLVVIITLGDGVRVAAATEGLGRKQSRGGG
jgi:hypothetical protein